MILCGPLHNRKAQKMMVKISFDKAAVEQRGYGLEDTYQTVKNLFAFHNFPCISEDSVLIFKDKGHGDDLPAAPTRRKALRSVPSTTSGSVYWTRWFWRTCGG